MTIVLYNCTFSNGESKVIDVDPAFLTITVKVKFYVFKARGVFADDLPQYTAVAVGHVNPAQICHYTDFEAEEVAH